MIKAEKTTRWAAELSGRWQNLWEFFIHAWEKKWKEMKFSFFCRSDILEVGRKTGKSISFGRCERPVWRLLQSPHRMIHIMPAFGARNRNHFIKRIRDEFLRYTLRLSWNFLERFAMNFIWNSWKLPGSSWSLNLIRSKLFIFDNVIYMTEREFDFLDVSRNRRELCEKTFFDESKRKKISKGPITGLLLWTVFNKLNAKAFRSR